ncbi:hypothetical protein OEZ85_000127 [Tetradesmus obliquus]|uniref:Uncharacterized protein n=1 Tax=Tetradesmus obliquus TaxID=3088 RepID=A0ABY8UP67_TETOB|nr:hypothetical protein OEZ85_000127 [Tetradesmus obliquus]
MLRELSSSVCEVEKQKVWGGKLQNIGPSEAAADAAANSSSASDTADHASIGTAGLWIHGSQKDIRCLANQLSVTLETSHDDFLIHARGRWSRQSAEPLLTTQGGRYPAPAFNLTDTDGDTEDLLDRLWGFLLGREATNPLTGATPIPHPATSCASFHSMGHYINSTLGPSAFEAYAFLIADLPEPGNFQLAIDVCAWIESEVFERTEMTKVDVQFIPRGGWHGLVERAPEYISSGCNGLKVFPNEVVLPRNVSMPGLNPATGKVLPDVE